MLIEAGAEYVCEADTAAGALEILEAGCEADRWPDIVLSDYYMLGLSGLDLLRSLRLDERFVDVPFILMSSDHSSERIAEAMEAGADEYLIKPFDNEALTSKLALVGLGGTKSNGPVAAPSVT